MKDFNLTITAKGPEEVKTALAGFQFNGDAVLAIVNELNAAAVDEDARKSLVMIGNIIKSLLG